jgi:IclR family acetate operon transcriptional repressor
MFPDEFDRHFRPGSFAKHNQNTIVSISRLKRELESVRQEGYALDDEEDEVGVRSVGAPVFDACRKVMASISVTGNVLQLPRERVEHVAKLVIEHARGISLQVGLGESRARG